MARYDTGPHGRPNAVGPERDDGFPTGSGAFQPTFDTDEFRDLDNFRLGADQPEPTPVADTRQQDQINTRTKRPQDVWRWDNHERYKKVDVVNITARGDAADPVL